LSGRPCRLQKTRASACRFGVACELDRACLGERRGGLLALTATEMIDRDILCATAVDPRVGGALKQHAGCCPVAHLVAHPE
jgi:hypothetical protein